MNNNRKNVERLYKLWIGREDENEKYLIGWLYWNSPLFTPTLEGLSAYKAYRSLSEEKRMEYAMYSSNLYDVFFLLNAQQISFVERTLPPYPYILEMVWKDKDVSKEDVEILKKKLSKNPVKSMKIVKEKERVLKKYGMISDEYITILERRKVNEWKDLQKIMALFYGITATQTYLLTSNLLAAILYLLSFPVPYQTLRYISLKLPDKRIRSYIDKISLLYFASSSPLGLAISTLEFGILAPLISKVIKKYWYSDYFPNLLRGSIYKVQTFLSGLKTKKFDEKEMRELLYNIKIESTSIPKSSIDRFREEIDNEIIEIEDPRKVLLDPLAISWFRRKVVVIPEGREIKIVDKEFVRKLAQKEGIFLSEMEARIKKYPLQYLGFDVHNGKLVFTRDIIGILPCQIQDALAYKEGYLAVLGKKADNLFEKTLKDYYIHNKRIIWQKRGKSEI